MNLNEPGTSVSKEYITLGAKCFLEQWNITHAYAKIVLVKYSLSFMQISISSFMMNQKHTKGPKLTANRHQRNGCRGETQGPMFLLCKAFCTPGLWYQDSWFAWTFKTVDRIEDILHQYGGLRVSCQFHSMEKNNPHYTTTLFGMGFKYEYLYLTETKNGSIIKWIQNQVP